MKTSVATRAISSKNIVRIVLGTALVLLVPLVAMQFSDQVNWSVVDFVTVGTLLIGAGLLFELVAAKASAKYRLVIATMITAAVLLVWAELAVGIFGSPIAGS